MLSSRCILVLGGARSGKSRFAQKMAEGLSDVIASNEVGLGLVPDNALGRDYRDILGKVNQMLSAWADEVYFMVSGIPLKIKDRTSH